MNTKINFYMQLRKSSENSLARLLTTHTYIREKESHEEVDLFQGKMSQNVWVSVV